MIFMIDVMREIGREWRGTRGGNFILYLFPLFLFPLFATAQTPAQLFKAGTESLSKGEYYAAARYLKQSLDKDENQAEVWYNYAEASRQFNDYTNAAKGYEECIKRDKDKAFPMALFWLGVMQQSNGEYDAAKETLTEFKTRYRKKDFFALKVQQLTVSCSWALANQATNDSIEVIHEADSINTTFSEINPIVSDEGLYFSSTKTVEGKVFRTRIYNATTNETFTPGMDNGSTKHVANGSFSNHKTYNKEFFFTQCGIENGSSRCEIFVSKFESNKWQIAKALPVNVNLPGHTATHPTVAVDDAGHQWLVFAANRPGGKGKMDIWLSKRLGAFEWDYPQNAGTVINTADDEVTPFYFQKDNTLYFSSNWHYGFGGFDVFKSKAIALTNSSFEKPKNLGLPLNSSANDLYFVMNDTVAYFSSNRKGSKFIEAETCCNDIYRTENGKQRAESRETTIEVGEQKAEKREELQVESNELREDKEALNSVSNKIEERKEDVVETKDGNQPSVINRLSSLSTINLTNFTLPIQLYFHNDEPDAKTMNDTTALSYLDAYQSYINLTGVYETEFAKGVKANDKSSAKSHIQSWFADTVEYNFKQLIHFSSLLLNELQQGKKVSITVTGYCSPLNFNEYNLHLGNRRVNSLLNFFYTYREGVLFSYLKDGKLMFERVSAGEEKVAKAVSDKLEDLRNSVYSPDAARERRVDILKVTVE